MKDNVTTKRTPLSLQRAVRPWTLTTLACLPLTALAQQLPSTLYAPGMTDLNTTIQQTIVSNPQVNAAWNNF